MWKPKNKKTGQEYPLITDAEKKDLENYYPTANKYVFTFVPDPSPKKPAQPAPEPTEAKKPTE